EGFRGAYDLPNRDAYAETCASIGLVFWAHRMLQIDLDSGYADVMERAFFNGLLSGVSLDGARYFYENPLSSEGDHHRQSFYSCSCCPPNVNRLLPTIGEYLYSITPDEIDIHLYVQSQAVLEMDKGPLTIVQETDYPWDGIVCINFEMEAARIFTLKLRKPGWCLEWQIYLNGVEISTLGSIERGYFVLSREWQPGDRLRLQWAMPAALVYPNPQIRADIGKAALVRGPLVYCLEEQDQIVALDQIYLSENAVFDSEFRPDVLEGVVVVTGSAKVVDAEDWGHALYRPRPPRYKSVPFRAIPYFAWDNRDGGAMRVWMPLVPVVK
ncbi:MAG: glycoside hydrolase family 127 protein, partial [Brevefilum sp.]